MSQEWQPIETVPTDGRRVFAIDSDIGMCVASPMWPSDHPEQITWWLVNDIELHLTHWMPLPDAPK